MKIKKVTEIYKNALRLIMDYPEKEYAFTSTIENAKKMEKDFVFIALMPFVQICKNLEQIIENGHCKGFIINKAIFSEPNNKNRFHNFMKELDFSPEVLLMAQNSYDIAYYIANENSKLENLETITVVGTDGASTIVDILNYSISKKFKVTASKHNWLLWQRIFEPLLVADEDTKYAIVEAFVESERVLTFTNTAYKNNVIYAKPVIKNMSFIKDFEEFCEIYFKAIERKERLKSIFTLEDENIISDNISYKYSDIIYRIPSDKKFEDKNYLIADAFLKHINIEPVFDEGFKEQLPLYKETTYKGNNLFVINPERVTIENIEKTLDIFSLKYKNEPTLIVYEHITNLNYFKNDLSAYIHKKFAKANPEALFLINTSAHIHEVKKINKNIFVKTMNVNEKESKEVTNFKKAIRDMSKGKKAVFVAMQDDFLSLFKENN